MHKFAYADLTNEKLRRDLGGADLAFPKLSKSLRLALRFSRQIGTAHVEIFPKVRELRATIGRVDLRPVAAQISFKVGVASPVTGQNVTALLDYPFTAPELESALNALSVVGTAVVVDDDSSYLVTGIPETLTTYENTLRPLSFGRVFSTLINGERQHEVRLQRAPFAFTDQYEQKVPPGPTIERVQAGGEADGVTWNEIQKLTTPRNFAGSYQIRRPDEIQRTALLGIADGPDEVARAMNPDAARASLGVAEDDGGLFVVTEHPTEPAMFIEFTGSMAGAAQSLLTVSVIDAPAGDFHLALDIDSAATNELWRSVDEVVALLEIYADIESDEDPALVYYDVPVYRGNVTLVEPVTHDDLGTPAQINYLEPPSAKSYLAVSPDSLTSGVRFYPFLLGDGVAGPSFAVPHGLASPRCRVSLRENASSGKELILGTDYDVYYGSDNQLTITLDGPYAAAPLAPDALAGVVQDLTVTSTWLGHSHTIAEVTGLQTILDAYGAAIAALQSQAGTGTPFQAPQLLAGPLTRALGIVWRVPRARALPARPSTLMDWRATAEDLGELPTRPLRLLPAVHVAPEALETLPALLPAPAASYAGRVFYAPVARPDFPGGALVSGDFAACDGREWYRVVGKAGTNSYYPAAFELTLFEVAINEREFPLRSTLELLVGFELIVAMLEKKARERRSVCRWTLALEAGVPTSDSAPTLTGGNLNEAFASPVTLLEQRLAITEIPSAHRVGCRLQRSGTGALTARAILYGRDEVTVAPPSVPFALRLVLREFDTENATTDARGVVAVRGLDIGMDGNPDSSLAKLVIS